MTLQLATIATSIAALEIAGVNVYGLDAIPTELTTRNTPALYPEPVNFVSNFSAEHASFDSGTDAPKTVRYNLTYTFAFAPVGSGRANPLELYAGMAEMAFAIWDAVLANDAINGAVDLQPQNTLYFGLVNDPAGNRHHGCQIVLRVTEFVN